MTEERKAGPTVRTVPEGDDRERLTCPDCGFINYENPKLIVGAVCEWEDKVLLCKRSIEPRAGYWTMPAGYMELNETAAEGAAREVWEEARATVEIVDLLGVYDIPRISQVYLVYRAVMATPEFAPGPESEEVGLFDWGAIPWDHLAFPSVTWALEHYRALKGQSVFSARSNSAEQAYTQRLR